MDYPRTRLGASTPGSGLGLPQAGAGTAPLQHWATITLVQTGTVSRWGKHRPVYAVVLETGETLARYRTFAGALTFARTFLAWYDRALSGDATLAEWGSWLVAHTP